MPGVSRVQDGDCDAHVFKVSPRYTANIKTANYGTVTCNLCMVSEGDIKYSDSERHVVQNHALTYVSNAPKGFFHSI